MNCDWSWENGEKKQHDWPVFVYCFTKHLTVYNRSLMLFAWTCTEMKESVIELVHTIFLFWFGNIRCLNLVLSLLWPRSNICTSCGRYIFLHGNSLMVRECLALVAWLATLVHFFFWFFIFQAKLSEAKALPSFTMTNVIWNNTLQNYVVFSYFCFYDGGKNGAQCNVFHVKYKTKNLH